jgi:hypothetical protein
VVSNEFPTDLYDYPPGTVGRRIYVSVRGHSRSIPKFKTYLGTDSRNHVLPEYGGDGAGFGASSAYYMPDTAGRKSPVDGSYIGSRSQLREHNLRNNVIEAGDTPMPTKQRDRDVHKPVSGRDIAESIRRLGGH